MGFIESAKDQLLQCIWSRH